MKKILPAIIGLGYVGLPLAVRLGKFFDVVGYDIDDSRIYELHNKNFDRTEEVSRKQIKQSKHLKFTNRFTDLKNRNIFIITLPTPITKNYKPYTKPIENFCKNISKIVKKKFTIILESTVYPGFCDEIIKILFEKNNLRLNKDFYIGYSPERVNPGKNKYKIENIIKVISGSNKLTLKKMRNIYSKVTDAGLYEAENIKIAEAAKVIENTQRDLNVAFINELTIMFKKMNIDIYKVLEAAKTKWNFLDFQPGMVGGHCISVDPYYLIHQCKKFKVKPKLIISGRQMNEQMPWYICNEICKKIKKKKPCGLVLGVSFKANCGDIRNSGSISLISQLVKKGHEVLAYDPLIDFERSKKIIGNSLIHKFPIKKKFDYIIFTVEHDVFKKLDKETINKITKKNGFVIDLKNIFKNKNNYLSI